MRSWQLPHNSQPLWKDIPVSLNTKSFPLPLVKAQSRLILMRDSNKPSITFHLLELAIYLLTFLKARKVVRKSPSFCPKPRKKYKGFDTCFLCLCPFCINKSSTIYPFVKCKFAHLVNDVWMELFYFAKLSEQLYLGSFHGLYHAP